MSKKKQDINKQIAKAERKMEKVMLEWFCEDPVMLGAWCIVDKIADPNQETIGIDSRTTPPVVKYNPNFIAALTQEQLECVLASEGFKILLRHPTTRLQSPKTISSLASQITVDQLIMGNPLGINDEFPVPQKFDLEPGSFFEDYFRKLMDKLPQVKKQLISMFGDPKDGKGQQGQGGGKPEEGQGKGKPQDGKDYKEYKDTKDALKDYFDPNGTSAKDWGKNDLFDAEVNQMINEKKGSTKDWGKFTGNAMGDVVAANSPKISYRDVLRRFNVSVLSAQSITSRMKVNRRYDLDAPGYRRQYKSKVIFAIDSSGSMSDEDLAEGFAVINSICKHAEIEYILFDTEIKAIEKKVRKAKKAFKVSGRGGTDFDAVCKYAEEHRSDGLIIYTDGYANAPPKPKGVKVLWLLSKKEQKPPVEWGLRATLDRYESH